MKRRSRSGGLLLGGVFGLISTFSSTAIAGQEECVDDWPNPDACFPDVLCAEYEQYWDLRRSVVHIAMPDGDGTGVLINNVNCHVSEDDCGVPYLLTANHVASGYIGVEMSDGEKSDLQTLTAFTFGFEAGVCWGGITDGAVALVGATIVAHSPELDLVLLRLTTSLPPELSAYFVGWELGSFDQGVAISHPCGATKRIAISEFGDIVFDQTLYRDVYDVYTWQEGALAYGSSGAPLLDSSTGDLKGIYTDVVGSGALTCFNSNLLAQDRFTAITDILAFLPVLVDGGMTSIDPFDSNEGAPLAGTVEDSSYYGEGEVREITAGVQVLLVDGFFAAKGSTITVRVEP